jgi:type I restriction enzyme, S subunit
MKVKLGDVATESRETISENRQGLPVVGLEHLTPNEITLSTWDVDTVNTFTKLFRKGQMLFGRRRAYLKKAAIAPFDGICSGDITVIEAIPDKILPELLPFIIQNDNFFDFAIGKSAGSLSPRVKWEHLRLFEFNLPSFPEQRKLTDLLWAVNTTWEAYKKLLNLTEEIVKSRFVEMFGDPTFSKGRNYLSEIITVRDDVRKPLNDEVRSNMREGEILYPYYGANGKVDEINEWMIDFTALCIAEDGGYWGSNEQCAYIIDKYCWVNNHAHVVVPNENCNIVWLQYFLNIKDLTPYITGSTRGKLTQNSLLQIDISLFPLSLQNTFAEFVKQADKSKFEIQRTIDALEATYKSILRENLG